MPWYGWVVMVAMIVIFWAGFGYALWRIHLDTMDELKRLR